MNLAFKKGKLKGTKKKFTFPFRDDYAEKTFNFNFFSLHISQRDQSQSNQHCWKIPTFRLFSDIPNYPNISHFLGKYHKIVKFFPIGQKIATFLLLGQ
jgi:hypothetical protein